MDVGGYDAENGTPSTFVDFDIPEWDFSEIESMLDSSAEEDETAWIQEHATGYFCEIESMLDSSAEEDETAWIQEHATGYQSQIETENLINGGHNHIPSAQEHETAWVQQHDQTGRHGDAQSEDDFHLGLLVDDSIQEELIGRHDVQSGLSEEEISRFLADGERLDSAMEEISRFLFDSECLDSAMDELIGSYDVQSGLSEEEISRYLMTRNSDQDRAVSHDDLYHPDLMIGHETDEQMIAMLDCGHEYYPCCIKPWLRWTNICPLCRRIAVPVLKLGI